MSSRLPLLVIGSIQGSVLEKVETSIALGFEPIGVLLKDCVSADSLVCYDVENLPSELRSAPCILGGPRNYSPLTSLDAVRSRTEGLMTIVGQASSLGFRNWITLVHPTAHVSPSASLGKGSFVAPLASVSSQSSVGDFVVIGRNSTVGHDVRIGNFTSIGPGASIPSFVSFGSQVSVGPGATFLNQVKVGQGAVVGAGSVVTSNVGFKELFFGNPAKSS